MTDGILGIWLPGPFEILAILVYAGVPIILIVVFLRLLLRNRKENIRLRIEVGKLADELEKVRKQKGADVDNPPQESG